MQIFLRTFNGKSLAFEVESSDTVGTVKLMLQSREGIPPEFQGLMYSGKLMEDARTLADYQVQSDTTLHLVMHVQLFRGRRQVFVKISPSGKMLTIDVDLGRDTVLDVKMMIEETLKIGTQAQRLIYAGKELENARPLKEYGVVNEAMLHVVPRLPGK